MIKIGEAAVILGLSESDKDKALAREVLNYFKVPSETPEKVPGTFGAVGKLYDKEWVEYVATCRNNAAKVMDQLNKWPQTRQEAHGDVYNVGRSTPPASSFWGG